MVALVLVADEVRTLGQALLMILQFVIFQAGESREIVDVIHRVICNALQFQKWLLLRVGL